MRDSNQILDYFEELPIEKPNYHTRYKEYLFLTIKIALLFLGLVFLQIENHTRLTPIGGTTLDRSTRIGL